MIILDNPYVSPLLEDSVVANSYPILDNEMVRSLEKSKLMKIVDDKQAEELLRNKKYILLYSNSENSINWISRHLEFSNLPEKINLFKNKVEFRKLMKDIYPDFYFFEVDINELEKINPDNIKFPVVLKPSVGFLSMGVYIVNNKSEWIGIIKNIGKDIEKFSGQFPLEVVDSSKFIVEEEIA